MGLLAGSVIRECKIQCPSCGSTFICSQVQRIKGRKRTLQNCNACGKQFTTSSEPTV